MNPHEASDQTPSILAAIDADLAARATPPDLVLDLTELVTRPPNPYDKLNRPRLTAAMYAMELQWTGHPLGIAQRVILTNRKIAPWLVATFCLSTLIVAPVVGVFGRGVLSPVTYPLICFLCGLFAFFRLAATSSIASAARWFVVPQMTAILIEWAYSPAISRSWSVIPVCMAIAGIGYLADGVNTHFVWLITANLNLSQDAVLWRRSMWNLRFNSSALTEEMSALRDGAESLEEQGDVEEAHALRRRINDVLELKQYRFGFFGLVYIALLHYAGVPNTLLVLAGFGVSVVLAFRRPLVTMKLRRLIAEINAYSFLSWFSWDPMQPWVHSPGMFRDGLYSNYQRLSQTVYCFVLIQIAFIPPVYVWGGGQVFTPEWLWTTGYHFFLNLFLPVFLLLCALIATGARPLWFHLAAVQWEGREAWG